MINPIDPFTLAGQVAAAEKVHELTQHQAAVQQQHLAQQARVRADHKQASVTAKTPAGEIVVRDESDKHEGGRRHAHHDEPPKDDAKQSADIPEVEEGRIIDIKI